VADVGTMLGCRSPSSSMRPISEPGISLFSSTLALGIAWSFLLQKNAAMGVPNSQIG
jgi:hypothetical protein